MQSSIDIKGYRRALAQFPTGVTVITTMDAQGEQIGVTASSFNSVSMDPPLVLWSVAKSAHSAAAFKDGKFFVVNILGRQQVELSNCFARQGEDKFSMVQYQSGIDGCPVLNNTAAYFECKTWNIYDGGDHIIVVGQVMNYHFSESVMPLVFARGSYSIATPQPVTGTDRGVKFPDDGFLSNYLLYLLHQAHALYAAELYPLLMSECGVSPEEWRVLTLLADTGPVHLEQLARLVMQPEEECRDCLQRLVERSYVIVDESDEVKIKSNGSDIASKLFSVAKTHEQTVFKTLSNDQQQHLGSSLVRMISAFGHPLVSRMQSE